jgi:hypothetical protein
VYGGLNKDENAWNRQTDNEFRALSSKGKITVMIANRTVYGLTSDRRVNPIDPN